MHLSFLSGELFLTKTKDSYVVILGGVEVFRSNLEKKAFNASNWKTTVQFMRKPWKPTSMARHSFRQSQQRVFIPAGPWFERCCLNSRFKFNETFNSFYRDSFLCSCNYLCEE